MLQLKRRHTMTLYCVGFYRYYDVITWYPDALSNFDGLIFDYGIHSSTVNSYSPNPN